jgi:hypothetical protein
MVSANFKLLVNEQSKHDLINTLCTHKTRKTQLNLQNEELIFNALKVLGFIGTFLFDFNVEVWNV